MTGPTNGRLLLDRISVYGAMVQAACSLLREQPMSADELRGMLTPGQGEETGAELIPFLQESGLVEVTRGRLRIAKGVRPDWTLQQNLLALLHNRSDINYAFRFVWEALIDRPEWSSTFINRDDVWPVINQVPVPGASLPQLNANRMASWMRLAAWMGLIQPERSNAFVILPTEELVGGLLTSVLASGQEAALTAWVSSVETQFCRITTGPGQLHPGFCAVLARLRDKGLIDFLTYSDEHLFQIAAEQASHVVLRKERVA